MRLKEWWSAFKGSKALRIIKNRYLLASLVFIVWITFFDSNNLVDWSKVIRNIGVQESQKREYKKAIKETEEKLKELSSNKDSLEKFAREQYLFKAEDEDIYLIEISP